MLFLASYRGRSTETGSLTSRILCKSAFIKIPNWNCSILSLFIVPDPGTSFGLERIEAWFEPRPWRSRRGPPLCPAALSSVWIFFWVCLGLRFWPVVPSIVSRENFTLEFSVFYRWGVWVQTVSSNNCKGKTSPLLHEWTDSFEISSIKLNLHWILQVSDPPNKFRGIKIRFFFCFVCFFIKLWEPKEIPLASYCWPSCSRRPRARAHPWGQTSTYLWCYLVAVMWYQ